MLGMAHGVVEGDKPPERAAEYDRGLDAEDFAKLEYVVRPLIQPPAIGRASIAAAVSPVVVVNDLRDVFRGEKSGCLNGVWSNPGPPWEHDQGWTLPHCFAVGNEARPIHIDG
jgi:hypothetical protein